VVMATGRRRQRRGQRQWRAAAAAWQCQWHDNGSGGGVTHGAG
jgi:hypothetical protein